MAHQTEAPHIEPISEADHDTVTAKLECSTMSSPDRLDQIQQELAGLLEERLGALTVALHASETTTRRIVAAELEMQRAQRDAERMKGELSRLESEAAAYAEQREALANQHAEALRTRDEKRQALEQLQAEVQDADAENNRDRKKLAALEEEASALRQENADLKMKLRTIEENIARMKSLRQEIMNSISGQTSYMQRLAGAGND